MLSWVAADLANGVVGPWIESVKDDARVVARDAYLARFAQESD